MHNSVQVELDVTSKSRVDEWHQRRATDQSKDAALSNAQAQVVKLTARVAQLELDHEALLKVHQETQSTIPAGRLPPGVSITTSTPSGPLAADRERVAELEQNVHDARVASREAALEHARLKSRLQLAEDECNILSQRLEVATTSLQERDEMLASSIALREKGEQTAQEVMAARESTNEHEAALLRGENERMRREVERIRMTNEQLSSELMHEREEADAQAERAAQDAAQARQVAEEHETVLQGLAQERDALQEQLQDALHAARVADLAAKASAEEADALRVSPPVPAQPEAPCVQCATMRKDNKQLFQDNQKLFRDNKKMAADTKALTAELAQAHENENNLKLEIGALQRVNADVSVDRGSTISSPDQRSLSLENGRLRQEVETLHAELEQLQELQSVNRSLSDKLSALSDEYTQESSTMREKLAQAEARADAARASALEDQNKMMETNRGLSAHNAALEQELALVKEDLATMRVDKTPLVPQLQLERVEAERADRGLVVESQGYAPRAGALNERELRMSSESVKSTKSPKSVTESEDERLRMSSSSILSQNDKLLADNKRMFADCQRFARALPCSIYSPDYAQPIRLM